MNTIRNTTSSPLNAAARPQPEVEPSDAGAVPLAAPDANAEKAASFDRSAQTKRPGSAGGDSRVVSPAGGGTGEVNNQQAIDGHSKRAGDFTEARNVGGKTVFLTPEGAKAVDSLLQQAKDSGAPLRAESDPSAWQRFWQGDPFEGLEQHSGKTK